MSLVKWRGGGAKETRTGATVHNNYALYMDYDTFFVMMMMIQELVNIEEKL